MEPISKQAVDELEKKFQVEKDLLSQCTTKFGAFDRIAIRILPMLRSDRLTRDLVGEWDRKSRDSSLLRQSYKELHDAYVEIVGNKSIHRSCRYRAMRTMVEACRQGSCFDILKSQPPCHRIYYKLRTIYVNAISKNWEIPFAPTALRFIQQTAQAELALKCDADPRHTWMQLSAFEECWSIRNEQKCIAWPRAKGKGIDKLLDADRVYRIARRCRLAADFSFLDDPDRKTEFFQREVLEQWIERLLNEILLILRDRQSPSIILDKAKELVVELPMEKKPHKRSINEKYDLDLLRPIAEEIWKVSVAGRSRSEIHNLSQEEVAKKIEEIARERGVALNLDVKARYMNAAKKTDPRIWDNGSYRGLKPGYPAK